MFNCQKRRYPNVEKLCQKVYGSDYETLLPDLELKKQFLEKLSQKNELKSVVTNPLESLQKQFLTSINDKIWPVMFINKVFLKKSFIKLTKFSLIFILYRSHLSKELLSMMKHIISKANL